MYFVSCCEVVQYLLMTGFYSMIRATVSLVCAVNGRVYALQFDLGQTLSQLCCVAALI